MAKGDYDFSILVTCLIILALQIHNPFQPRQNGCNCRCDAMEQPQPASKASQQPPGREAPLPQQQANVQQAEQPAPTVYRRPREAAPASSGAGLSTDALLRELDSIQAKAKEQQETLTAAGRMPPASPILEHLRETEAMEAQSATASPNRGVPVTPAMPAMPAMSAVPANTAGQAMYGGADSSAVMGTDAVGTPMIRRRDDIGRFLEARLPRGLGVVLGVGRGDFALRLLMDWASSQGVFLVDPFIHIWRGYDDPANLNDREHQLVFEDLRARLQRFEGRYVLERDFSHSFAEKYRSSAPGLPTFVYIDANHAEQAITRDLELWWPLLAPGGMLAGSSYLDEGASIRVRSAVDRFVAMHQLQLYLTHDDMPPSWFVFKS